MKSKWLNKIIFSGCLLFSLFISTAAWSLPGASLPKILDPTKAQAQPKLEMLKNFNGKNQIKLLNNRFRIDYEVDELLLLLFRKHGSTPIVLVRPDGSKIFVKDAETGDVEWHADVSYDLIRLTNPMPGPWQALGKILDNSKILVLSDVQLVADPLPKQVFQSEVIKSQAKILNAKEMISDPSIRDVVQLRAYLYSGNDPKQKNFGAGAITLGDYFDDGRLLDERPRDGIFTIQYNFNCEVGSWIPKYRAKAELFTREVVQSSIQVLPTPISFETSISSPEEKYHFVTIQVDPTFVDESSLVFQGTISFPNGEEETFHLNENQDRKLKVFQAEFGEFVVKTDVFGKDLEGREFVLSPPAHVFYTERPVVPESTAVDAELDLSLKDKNSAGLSADFDNQPLNEEIIKEEPVAVGLIITLNALILTLGFLVIWLVVLKRTIPNPFKALKNFKFKKKSKSDGKSEKADTKNVDEKAPKAPASDDILDLSLPDD